MRTSRIFILLATVSLLPFAALAEDDFDVGEAPAAQPVAPVLLNEATVETTFQNDASYRSGRYNGRVNEGAGVNGGFVLQQRPAHDSGQIWFWRAEGQNLGLTSRSLSAMGGEQGQWKLALSFDDAPFYGSNQAKSLYGTGGDALPYQNRFTIPAAGQSSTAALAPYLGVVDLHMLRRTMRVQGERRLDSQWSFSGSIKHQQKTGTKAQSLYWGATPAVATTAGGGSVFFGETVDYQTESVESKLTYQGARTYLELGYNLSIFNNAFDYNRLGNPFRTSLATMGSSAQYSLPPDNMAHEVTLAGLWRLGPDARLNLNLGYGVQMQDESFLPVSTVSGVNAPLSRSSLDGMVQTQFAHLAYSSRPLAPLDLRASYSFDGRQNDTQPMSITVVPGDSSTGAALYTTHPYSFQSQTAKLDAGWRVDKATRLNVGYSASIKERDHLEVDRNVEHSVHSKLSHSFTPQATGWMSYGFGHRTVNHYDSSDVYPYDQQRKFFEAERRRQQMKIGTNLTPSDAVSLGVSLGHQRDDYPSSTFGMERSSGWVVDSDLSWNPAKTLKASVFYTYEQQGFSSRSTCNVANATTCPTPRPWQWSSLVQDRVHSLGLDGQWQAVEDFLTLGARYSLSHASTFTDLSAENATAQASLTQWPTQRSILHSLALHGDMRLNPNVTLRLGYAWDWLSASDWAYDGWGATMGGLSDTNNMLTQGEDAQGYQNHLFTVGLRIRW